MGDTVVVRYIARSDGSVVMAIPTIAIRDDTDVLAVYVPNDTVFKDNWVVPPEQRVAAVDTVQPSRERKHIDRVWHNDAIRLYLPGQSFSVWLFFNQNRTFVSWYGNLEAPFVRTQFGIDTRDHGLDVIAHPDGRWSWKDEEEFARRLAVGIDSAAHQAAVRAAGETFIDCFQRQAPPFNQGWEHWRPAEVWPPRDLPADWNADFRTHDMLT